MTIFYLHEERLRGLVRPALGRIIAAFRIVHQAIVTAKLRRLRRELTFRVGPRVDPDEDGAKFPQQPLILGDKWDF
jgi:hypothetical protein